MISRRAALGMAATGFSFLLASPRLAAAADYPTRPGLELELELELEPAWRSTDAGEGRTDTTKSDA